MKADTAHVYKKLGLSAQSLRRRHALLASMGALSLPRSALEMIHTLSNAQSPEFVFEPLLVI